MLNLPIARQRPGRPAVLCVILALAPTAALRAQCAPLRTGLSKLQGRNAQHGPLLPESGYLSDTTYTSLFFGFALDLPIPAQGHMVRLPLMPERQHALLAIAFQHGDRSGSLTIDALEPREGLEGFSVQQQQQQQQLKIQTAGAMQAGAEEEPRDQPQVAPQGTLIAPQPQPASPQFQLPTAHFHSSQRRQGEKYTALYWTEIRNYRVGVLVTTNDKDFLQRSKQAMAALRFYCVSEDGTLATKEGDLVTPAGEPYDGPTVPTWRADVAIQSNRGLAIAPGEITQGVYHNQELDLQYELPKGWDVLPTHNSGNPPADLSSLREFQLVHACSRTLLRIRRPASSDAAGPGPQPMIVLRALDPICLSIRTPTGPSDTRIAEEVGVSLEALSEFGQVASQELVPVSGRLFMVFHGTIAVPAEKEKLDERMAQTMFATIHKQMLLIWSFLAPTSGQLAAMPASGVQLGDSESIELGPELPAKP